VETLVRKYRWVKRLEAEEEPDDLHALRSVDYYYDGDGMLVIRGRLPPDQGALVVKAIEAAMEATEAETAEPEANETRLADELEDVDSESTRAASVPAHARRADALVELAECRLSGNRSSSTADRYSVVVHVAADRVPFGRTHGGEHDVANSIDESSPRSVQPAHGTPTVETSYVEESAPAGRTLLPEDHPCASTRSCSPREESHLEHDPNGSVRGVLSWQTSHLENGPHVSAETTRRLSCDGAIIALLEDSKGIPLSIGRKSRTIPPGMRRALVARDGGCRFPGCTHTKFVDGHHIRHWANGGETSLDNLVLLCRRHHRLVHEGGFGCEKTADGEVIFLSPEDERLPDFQELPGIETGEDPIALLQRHLDTSAIDEHTCETHCYAGDRIDWHLAVSHLM
jgi:hypothetical protein